MNKQVLVKAVPVVKEQKVQTEGQLSKMKYVRQTPTAKIELQMHCKSNFNYTSPESFSVHFVQLFQKNFWFVTCDGI